MYIIQRHHELDNGADAVWLWNDKEKALRDFSDNCEKYRKVCSDEGETDEWGNERDFTKTCVFHNADESTTTFILRFIDTLD